MKKTLRWIAVILLSPVALFLLLAVLIYLPPVQNWVVKQVASYASEKTGMQISIDHVDLDFPLDLGIDGFRMIQGADTIADVERLVVDVELLPLLKSRVVIDELEISNAKMNTADLVASARVKGELKRLFLTSRGIDLDQQTVDLNGATLDDARFDVALVDTVIPDTSTTKTLWKIYADSLTINRLQVALHMPGDTMSIDAWLGRAAAYEGVVDLEQERYTVGRLVVADGRLLYDQNYEPAVEGFDYNHIALTGVQIDVDSIAFQQPDLRMRVNQLAMRDKSGLEITELSGPFSMDATSIHLPQARLRTPDSEIDAEFDMDMTAFAERNPGLLRLRLNAQLGKQDLMRFMGGMPQKFQQQWPNYPLSIRGSLNGNMQAADFTGLVVDLPTAFHATANGTVAHADDLKRLKADVELHARTENLNFLASLSPQLSTFNIPHGITLDGLLHADSQRYSANFTAREGGGTVKGKGMFDANVMAYDADVKIQNLNIHHWMPRDSIYTLTADVKAKGRGTDLFDGRSWLEADARIAHLRYGSWDIDHVDAQALLKNGVAHADVVGDNALFDGHVVVDALLSTRKLDATISTDLSRVDLYRLRLMDSPLTFGMCSHLDVQSDLNDYYSVQGTIDDLVVSDSVKTYHPTNITVDALTRRDTTWAHLNSGDIVMNMHASGGYQLLIDQLMNLTDEANKQWTDRIIDQPKLLSMLPRMHVDLRSGDDNPVMTLLRAYKTSYKRLALDLTTSPETGINGSGYVHSLVVDSMRLDTIAFETSTKNAKQVRYSVRVENNRRNPQFVFKALLDGTIHEHGAVAGLRYYDADGRMGLRIGANAELLTDGINLHLVPSRPTLGYKEFTLNDDNFIFLGPNNRIKANVDLVADDGTGVKIYSEDDTSEYKQDLTVSLNRFNLGEITSVFPYYLPRMGGLLNGDYHVVQDENDHFSVVSDMSVRDFSYENSPIGNLSTEFVYLQKEDDTHAVEARIMKDDIEVGLLRGTYYNEGEGSLDGVFTMERFPIDIVNGFVPDHLLGLEGLANGQVNVKGRISKLQVNGEVVLDSAYLVSEPYGIRMRFDRKPIRVVGSNLLLEDFNMYAYNEHPLTLTGHIDFADMEKMAMHLRMRANDFLLINAKENNRSLAYGKAYVNFLGVITGPVENLRMRGKLDVLGSTDLSYILRDSPLTTDNQLDELVKFTDFSDTTQTVVNRPVLNGFNMNLTIDVSQGAHVMAYLNADKSNYIDLVGGGTLRMEYTPTDNLRLTGKYTLNNGEMKYSLPIIPLKTFTIQNGSYIEFTGDMMNPTLNITATERVKSTVSNESGIGRSVEFDCGVIITKTLNDMGLEFTLDAPEDMQLHGELLTMSAEQRGKLAVSMLTTGMYLADGNTNAFSMNSALSSFLSNEINNLTGNALRTLDLSFGLDNSTDATGAMHTDYSFKFAKRFWNNRLRIVIGGKVSTGAELQNQNKSFFDNVTFEYRLDDTANKYVTLFYQNNAYDWLDGYTQQYGAGFIWRRTLQSLSDIFRFKADTTAVPPAPAPMAVPADSIPRQAHE